LKLKLFNLTGIAGGYLFLVLPHSEPPLKQQSKAGWFDQPAFFDFIFLGLY
jgi:hypothetical protein